MNRPLFTLAAGACWLLSASLSLAQTQRHQVRFAENEYLLAPGETLRTPVLIDPLPAAGLFSYGVIASVRGENNLVGVVNLTPRPTLAFDGPRGPGNQTASATGVFSGKGSVDLLLPAKPPHRETTLAELSLGVLPEGTYQLDLALYNTLGPTESVFVDGRHLPLDPLLDFGSAFLEIVSTPEGTLSAAGPLRPDRQTDLLLQDYTFTNTGKITSAFRIYVRGVSGVSGVVTLWNAHGTENGVPYVDVTTPLAPGASVKLTLEYRSADRATLPAPVFEVVGLTAAPPPAPTGLQIALVPRASIANGDVLLEWESETGKTYHVQYSSDAATWHTAQPPIAGTGNRVQWIDNGPPKTESHPSTVPARFYRLVVTDAN